MGVAKRGRKVAAQEAGKMAARRITRDWTGPESPCWDKKR